MASAAARVMFLCLGRHGAMPRLTLQLAHAAAQCRELSPTFVIARGSELTGAFAFLGERLLAVDTIGSRSPVQAVRHFRAAGRRIGARVESDRCAAVIDLCPHLWTPLLVAPLRRRGAAFATVMHDATGHPGDPGRYLAPWFRAEARAADLVFTLSRFVAAQLARLRTAPPERLVPLFLPDLVHGSPCRSARRRAAGTPLRLLFLGRMHRYKGLALLLDALQRLAHGGVRLTVAGSGAIAQATAARLQALGAEVLNRWIDDGEMGPLLARHDAVVLSHLEASQSGVAAAAFGSGLPAVAVPVGGLVEQVLDGRTGVLAAEASAPALARAIARLAGDAGLYDGICLNLRATAHGRSTESFLESMLGGRAFRALVRGTDAPGSRILR
jgi:glycosyltransferase involved in cell wall biosynthesis